MSKSITIRIPDSLKREAEKLAKSQDVPISDIVRESLKRFVAIQKFRKIRNRVLPFAESQGLLTDEDIFKEIS